MTIKEYCTQKGITMKDFAKELGCSCSYVSRIYHGYPMPNNKIIEKLQSLEIEITNVLTTREKLIQENDYLRDLIKHYNKYIDELEDMYLKLEKTIEKIKNKGSVIPLPSRYKRK